MHFHNPISTMFFAIVAAGCPMLPPMALAMSCRRSRVDHVAASRGFKKTVSYWPVCRHNQCYRFGPVAKKARVTALDRN
jgi:hypothetical protein